MEAGEGAMPMAGGWAQKKKGATVLSLKWHQAQAVLCVFPQAFRGNLSAGQSGLHLGTRALETNGRAVIPLPPPGSGVTLRGRCSPLCLFPTHQIDMKIVPNSQGRSEG